jgi:prepilin-type N-terminal cleavage/methylation domain-containing protein
MRIVLLCHVSRAIIANKIPKNLIYIIKIGYYDTTRHPHGTPHANAKHMTFSHSQHSAKGFSLIELLIVIGMLGILSAVTIPLYMNNIPRFQLKGAARTLMSDFQKTKLEAVKRDCDVQLIFTTGTYTKAGGVGSYRIVETAGNTTLLTRTLPKDTTLFGTTFSTPANTTGFTEQGLPWNATSGSVYLVNNLGMSYKISLSLAGNVSMTLKQLSFDVDGNANPSTW